MIVSFPICIAVRLMLATMADRGGVPFRLFAGALGCAFLLIFLTNARTFGQEVNNGRGGRIWWNSYRPVHALLWGLFALTGASAWLFADVGLGLIASATARPFFVGSSTNVRGATSGPFVEEVQHAI